jgi:hypothetical protein
MKPYYPGQGQSLPGHMPRGVWVVEHRIYLSCDDLRLPLAAPAWTGDANWLASNGSPPRGDAVGFSAERMAQGMHVSVDEVLHANRNGQLRVTLSPVRQSGAGESARVRFLFEYQGRRFEVTCRL